MHVLRRAHELHVEVECSNKARPMEGSQGAALSCNRERGALVGCGAVAAAIAAQGRAASRANDMRCRGAEMQTLLNGDED